ncbi:hypothetical protein PTSG_06187 [Salpingoeca rosetta]|uniref:Actin-related protein 2/3 complex subunit 5 n=1 Tax=Salpingoeca rosetta (strain ATCC 50818 / BSB-021) TaxID=946362 RepID=F2UC72_SALR5|nr:uncharacterized protein PTSG_06187 [Salpingoeca rosetta]EGD74179.1 hypothetical protein PTSG_06187 [Salpingoeca rosetta]|eukprot:XP_004993079.1 hypothetical protein PTSG_06187 [Salpingoeca rosetta]
MAKRTRSDGFRRTDIDKFDEDKYHDEVEASQVDSALASQMQKEAIGLLNGGKKAEALKAALKSPPLSYRTAQPDPVKVEYLKVVLDILGAFKSTEVAAAVKELSQDECDLLMKFVYRGMEYLARPNTAAAKAMEEDEARRAYSNILLTWHKQATEHGGLGCVVRAMADRKTV